MFARCARLNYWQCIALCGALFSIMLPLRSCVSGASEAMHYMLALLIVGTAAALHRSGYTLSKLLNLWMNGFTSFSVKPLRIATYIGTLFAMAGFLYFIYIIIDHFTRAAAPIGWASTTALLLLLGGMILVVLGIMGEYVGRIYMCAIAAPQYVEREVIRHEDDDA